MQTLTRKFSSLIDVQGWQPGMVLSRKADDSGFEWITMDQAQGASFYYDGSTGSSLQWDITHNLNQELVTVMVKDTVHPQNSYLAQQIADVTYVNPTMVRLVFQAPFCGYAYIYK